MKGIICDLDGTLFDNSHRQHFVTGEKKDWASFNSVEEIKKDTVNDWCYQIISRHMKDHYIYFVTGRMGTNEVIAQTLKILSYTFEIGGAWSLLLRKEGDLRDDAVIKQEIYEQNTGYEISFCIDDRQRVVDMWRSLGLVCLQCAKGDF